jgi:hypothetical protein
LKAEFVKYLDSIGITETLHKRFETIIEFYEETYSVKIADIFVSDYIEKEGNRVYQHLCLFSEDYFMDAKLFLQQDDFSVTPLRGKIVYLSIKKAEYDFKHANDNSRVNVFALTSDHTNISLQCSKENCDHFKEIILKYFIPNLQK